MSPKPSQKPHKMALLVYLLLLTGAIFGITALVGVIINHANLKQTNHTYLRSHFIWQMITFWTLLLLAIIAYLTWPSWGLLYAGLIWWICALMIGLYYLRCHREIPFIKSTGGIS